MLGCKYWRAAVCLCYWIFKSDTCAVEQSKKKLDNYFIFSHNPTAFLVVKETFGKVNAENAKKITIRGLLRVLKAAELF